MRRITSRFSAKLFFQASSSASDARIWDAIASCSSGGKATTFFSAFSKSVDMPQSYQQAPPAIAGQFEEIDRPVNLRLNLRNPKATEARSSAVGSGHNPVGSRSAR